MITTEPPFAPHFVHGLAKLDLGLVLDVLVDGEHDVLAVDRVEGLLNAAGDRPALRVALAQDNPGPSREQLVVLGLHAGQALVVDAHEAEDLARELARG